MLNVLSPTPPTPPKKLIFSRHLRELWTRCSKLPGDSVDLIWVGIAAVTTEVLLYSEQRYRIGPLDPNGCVCHLTPFIWTGCETEAAGWEFLQGGNIINAKSWREVVSRGGCCFYNGLISSKSQTNYLHFQLS